MANDSNDKPKYEIPIVIALGELAKAVGACGAGSYPGDDLCHYGHVATGGDCQAGGVAEGGACHDGTSACCAKCNIGTAPKV